MDLKHKFKNAWEIEKKENAIEQVMEYARNYMDFLSKSKTERLSVKEIIKLAKENGYISIDEAMENGSVSHGDKIYAINKEKAVALFVIGKNYIEKGMKIIGSHIDSPRLDLKPNPLYQEANLGFFKTHYYGGIKKYQWTAIPLALHGVVILNDGTKVDVSIGEEDSDPVFCVTDLLVHLAGNQMQKKLSEGISGEALNVLIGNMPLDGEEKEPITANILKILNEKYSIVEEDLLSAEIEVVPAGKARDLGFDRSMVLGYGHDDRVCSYAAVKAILETRQPEFTSVTLCVDKEEVGSQGNTGMHSKFFENTVAELIALEGDYCDIKVRRALANSKVLSADVAAGYDPNFDEAYEKRNSAYMGNGIVLNKYTGSRGKSGCNDANAEFISEVKRIFNEGNVVWQTAELGKVDQGGGGTIAYILANQGAEVIDCGVGVLNMHAPHEIVSKVDIYEMYKGYKSFFNINL
ncbi:MULTISPECIES: aminopeptidase [unclassified Clostridioides]|uniref:aminopeptidase n=1 Tax=unclassified Clostridioides TaxID=2635829 RepID=UPI001D0C11D7|nr:aminopeptidase [Clostridioides sp. ES-S-0001-02]MCC0640618.1 aminopeptidase [Clostridioides sp. ES-S-0049-03]MCC0651596.1 aminopeptidase [Clostridioides sp. ES-S-0001-03]MCC0657402.1 aminopeptidase [Clostridioides sp. ES-S-0123-01]MCC0672807.1 aminopeptidase [Clostridioides sp. ES-S-0145-01]MCC0676713.1 aminopeptidase [Clostridioides sp. ES-W-0018-02]MCC0703155.1 aminopeptidase [Clostridioides sp. ES-S-0049-02]MCC0708439.1 aminopeptidase [Clostridioides sp. ES-S-0190-01]MCC0711904.1 amin